MKYTILVLLPLAGCVAAETNPETGTSPLQDALAAGGDALSEGGAAGGTGGLVSAAIAAAVALTLGIMKLRSMKRRRARGG